MNISFEKNGECVLSDSGIKIATLSFSEMKQIHDYWEHQTLLEKIFSTLQIEYDKEDIPDEELEKIAEIYAEVYHDEISRMDAVRKAIEKFCC